MQWYYTDNNQNQSGPVDESEISVLIQAEKIVPGTRVWTEGMDSWVPAANTPLKDRFPKSIPPPLSSASQQTYCGNCGTAMPTASKFCPRCGASVLCQPNSVVSDAPITDLKGGKKNTFLGKAHLIEGVTAHVADLLKQENLLVQVQSDGHRHIIQARQKEIVRWKDIARKVLGMEIAATVIIVPSGNDLVMEIGAGKWLDKAVGAGIGWFLFAPTILTTGWGFYMQTKLFSKIKQGVDEYIKAQS